MKDEQKTKSQLIVELQALRQQLAKSKSLLIKNEQEENLNQQLAYEHAAGKCIRILAESSTPSNCFPFILNILQNQLAASRVYIFKNEEEPDLGLCMTQIHECCASAITPQINNPALQHLPYKAVATSLLPSLLNRQPWNPIVTEMNEQEREALESQQILSILIVPIFSNNTLWGFIGIDDCHSVRHWQKEDIHILQSVADASGAAILREHTLKELAAERAQLLSIFDSIDEICYITDPATYEILYVNKTAQDAFAKPLIGRICHKEFQGLDHPCDFCTNDIILKQNPAPHRWIYHNPTLNRDYAIVDRIIQWSDGRDVRFEFARDITKQVLAEQDLQKAQNNLEKKVGERTAALDKANIALHESENKLTCLFNAMPDIAFLADYNGVFLTVNHALAESMGRTEKELVGSSMFKLLPPETSGTRKDKIQKVVTSKKPLSWEDERDGNYFHNSVYPILDRNGNVTQLAAFARNITEQFETARELNRSRKYFQTLVETLKDVVIRISITGEIEYCSPAITLFGGYDAATVIGNHFEKYFADKQELAIANQLIITVMLTHESGAFEFHFLPKDMVPFPVEVTWQPLLKNDVVTHLQFVMRDISEQTLTKKRLMQSKLQLRQIIDLVPACIFVKDKTAKYEIVNKATAEVFGTTVENLTGKRDADFVATEEEAALFRADDLEVIHSSKAKFIQEELITDSKNNKKYMQTTKVPFNFSATHGPSILGVAIDITERVLLEKALFLEKQRLQHILEGTNIGTWEWNIQTGETIFNERWATMLGYTIAELSPVSIDTWLRLAHPDDLEISGSLLEKHFNGESDHYEFESRMRHKNGSWVWVLGRGRVFTWTKEKKPLMMCGTHQDITRRKKAEEELKSHQLLLEQRVAKRTEELKNTQLQLVHSEKLSAIGRLSASIAHEFNNPLNGIQSVLEGVQQNNHLKEEDATMVGLALNECDRVRKLIRNLLDFNAPSLTKKETFHLHAALDEILSLCAKDLRNNSIKVQKEYVDELPVIRAVPDQIKQVILNLVTNARDAMRENGGLLTLRTEHNEQQVTVHLSDTGAGIDQKTMGFLFEPFFTTKSVIKGTGLGLSVSHGIMKNHGGTIDVKSVPGEGSTFSIALPIEESGT